MDDTAYLDINNKLYRVKFFSEQVGTCSLTEDDGDGKDGQVSRFFRRVQGLPLVYEQNLNFELYHDAKFQPYEDQKIGRLSD